LLQAYVSEVLQKIIECGEHIEACQILPTCVVIVEEEAIHDAYIIAMRLQPQYRSPCMKPIDAETRPRASPARYSDDHQGEQKRQMIDKGKKKAGNRSMTSRRSSIAGE
jgi:hypothetical protein